MLLFHAMGTGKTRSALAIAEANLHGTEEEECTSNFVGRKYGVIGGTATIIDIIDKNEAKILIDRAGKQHEEVVDIQDIPTKQNIYRVYIIGRNKQLPKTAFRSELKKMYPGDDINPKYKFYSFSEIASRLNTMTPKQALYEFNNSVFILDEVHHLLSDTSEGKKRELRNLMNLFRMLPNRKIILLTGTPMVNSPKDIVQC